MKAPQKLCVLMALFIGASSHPAAKTLIDYFLPMPIQSPLVSNVWGDSGIFPRDLKNGLEDATMKLGCYWDGPWEFLGSIKIAESEFKREGRMSNVSIMLRPDGDFMIVPRSGGVDVGSGRLPHGRRD